MNRRPFLQTIATGGALLSAGCVESIPFTTTRLESEDVFEEYWYEETELVVQFREDVDVERAVLTDLGTDEEYETTEQPGPTVRFPVVFPERRETYLSQSLRVTAETPDGEGRLGVGGPVHAYVDTLEPLPDGRARLEIESQTDAPLLVGFVGVYGDVPNPTADPQSDSFDPSTFEAEPGVVGVGANRPLSPSRTDLVVPPGETRAFETTYAPFAFSDSTASSACDGEERRGKVAVVHGSGGSAAYDFTYRLEGESAALEDGLEASVCDEIQGGR
ncbi:hypothetical protein [Natronobacterium texcoconense]|uniref:Uncharacterized protein n=1 Tax=Natronobacterium texcoconense TaxID=1095778 RepID=A0A1H1EXK2_NATTX|nr:hypothetical protein [Natronobacterium texcoconense]SDQ93388.1 hypothetical protein SAMN04489842_1736 [Natronobacterium texcoconense]